MFGAEAEFAHRLRLGAYVGGCFTSVRTACSSRGKVCSMRFTVRCASFTGCCGRLPERWRRMTGSRTLLRFCDSRLARCHLPGAVVLLWCAGRHSRLALGHLMLVARHLSCAGRHLQLSRRHLRLTLRHLRVAVRHLRCAAPHFQLVARGLRLAAAQFRVVGRSKRLPGRAFQVTARESSVAGAEWRVTGCDF